MMNFKDVTPVSILDTLPAIDRSLLEKGVKIYPVEKLEDILTAVQTRDVRDRQEVLKKKHPVRAFFYKNYGRSLGVSALLALVLILPAVTARPGDDKRHLLVSLVGIIVAVAQFFFHSLVTG